MTTNEQLAKLKAELANALSLASALSDLARFRGTHPEAEIDRAKAERYKGKAEGLAIAIRIVSKG